jgi:glycerophosphoryl diester phosphodiesterase
MIVEHVNKLEKKIANFIKEAKKGRKKAKKAKEKHYFEGQKNAFKQILLELKNLKYKLETSVKDDEEEKEKVEQKAEAEEGENLLKKALEKGIIIRKTSYYLHEDLPNGKVHGKSKILQALNDRSFCKKITRQIASAEESIKK